MEGRISRRQHDQERGVLEDKELPPPPPQKKRKIKRGRSGRGSGRWGSNCANDATYRKRGGIK